MLSLNKFFDHPAVVAFTSDAAIDFTLNESAPALTGAQQSYLSEGAGISVSALAWARQVHGSQVIVADEGLLSGSLKEADAFVTDCKNIPIAIRTADCLPIFLFDPPHQAIGIVHAGWKGTQKEIVKETFEVMQGIYKTDCEDILVGFGPSIRNCCYEVGKDVARYFPNATSTHNGKLFIDLIKANRDQLFSLGVERPQLFDARICTACDRNYFSFRRDKEKAGRMVSVMMIKG